MYLSTDDSFRPHNIPLLVKTMTQYNSNDANGFLPGKGDPGDLNYPWDEWFGQADKLHRKMFKAYHRRSYFYAPHKRSKPMVLSTEELASIYHFPGGVAQAPTFKRVESKKSEPPSDLPT